MSAPVQSEPRSTFERVLARRTDDLSQRQAERATELVQQGAGQRDRRRRVTLARVAGAALGLLFLRLVFGGTPGRRGNEPIGAGAVATADGAGVGSSVSAFLPQARATAPSESAPTTVPALPVSQSAAHTSSPAAVATQPVTRYAPARATAHEPAAAVAPPLLLAADDAQGDFGVDLSNFLGRALLFALIVDRAWVAHQLIEGACGLRISGKPPGGVEPQLVRSI